ncbi:TIGR03862 family flavoprotein [Amaricoccus tamworthensis]|uniref:TIGR03862 family flavoprotein n=1 Tax=Amaricoccus tamworthensis TaxID=57002 RepID=UPI003C7B0F3D
MRRFAPGSVLTSLPEPLTPDALVIGAGPAGLMAADMISAAGRRVVIADAMPSPARKFLMAGKSGLNVSRDQPLPEFVSSYFEGGEWLAPILDNFGPQDVKVWLDSHGIEHFTGSSKRIFPQGMKASPLLRSWLGLLAGRGVELKTRWRWDGWDGDGYRFLTPDGPRQVRARCAVLAVGGASWSRLGSTGSWTRLFEDREIELNPFKPTNVGCRVPWSEHMEKHFGQPVKPVRMQVGSAEVHGEFVISRKGLEGGGIYLLSNRLREGEPLVLDLLPHMDRATVAERLTRPRGRNSFSNHMRKALGLTPVKIALFRECFDGDVSDVDAVAGALKALRPQIAGPLEIDEAISTGGGVPETALDGNLMLRAAPGVFCAGEMLDWDAPTGGYLLTACLATGRHAGMAAAGWLESRVATPTPAC